MQNLVDPERPSMKVVTVKFGEVPGGAGGHKIWFLGAQFFCDEQEGCQIVPLFSLGCIGPEAKRRE